MIAWRSAGTRWYQPARYSASCAFNDICTLLVGLGLSDGPSSCFQQRLHPRPGIRREGFKGNPVGVPHAIKDRGLDGRSLSHSRPPVSNSWVFLPHCAEFEQFKTQNVGDHGTVSISEG